MHLSDLSLVLIDTILPWLDAASLLALSSTSRAFRSLISGPACEGLWRRHLVQDFAFDKFSARVTGFLDLYKAVQTSELYVFGATGDGRLGLPSHLLEAAHSRHGVRGGLATPARVHIPGVTLVALAASGWATCARDSMGKLWVWGVLDGEGWAGPNESFTNPHRRIPTPTLLPVTLPKIISHDCGRAHLLALDEHRALYSMSAYGLAHRLHDREGRWLSGAKGLTQIQTICAGWDSSAILLRDGSVFVWQQETTFGREQRTPLVDDEESPSALYAVVDKMVDSVHLPALPREDAENRSCFEEIAVGEGFVIGRAGSQLYKISLELPEGCHTDRHDPITHRERYNMALRSGAIAWQKLVHYTGCSSVIAHFRRFAGISAATADRVSQVLFGDSTTMSSSRPQVLPDMPTSVASLALGDYHSLVLDHSGRLFAWGETSHGRLGRAALTTRSVSLPLPVDVGAGYAFAAVASGWHSACLVLIDPTFRRSS